jgi:hypothetical protein
MPLPGKWDSHFKLKEKASQILGSFFFILTKTLTKGLQGGVDAGKHVSDFGAENGQSSNYNDGNQNEN